LCRAYQMFLGRECMLFTMLSVLTLNPHV
jgi:hypothetical protein